MKAYYNENDPKAAAWLRELIKAGHIADGDVDERSIEDVTPNELIGFNQCHFFAGIGVWSYALRQARWPDDRPVWTGSCPCQPFSTAGKGAGFADERHLWPSWFHLIIQCQPATIFGEQVASKDGLSWLDLVQADLEAAGYANAAFDLCAAGVGAPHIRQRLFFVADANDKGLPRYGRPIEVSYTQGWDDQERHGAENCVDDKLADSTSVGQRARRNSGEGDGPQKVKRSERLRDADRTGKTKGVWRDADWLCCTDGKWRPVEPGTSPLANGSPARVGRLRGYGNAIVAPVAQAFIESYMSL